MLLHVAPLLIDPDREFLACRQWVAGRTGALGVAPDPLIRIQAGCTAWQAVQAQLAVRGRDAVAHPGLLVGGQPVHHQVHRSRAPRHQSPGQIDEQLDEQLGVQPTFAGGEPEPALGIHRQGRRDRLTLARTLDGGGLAVERSGLGVHRVGTKARAVPLLHLSARLPGLRGDAGTGFVLPAPA